MKMEKSYHLGREMKRALIAKAMNKPYVAPIFEGTNISDEIVSKSEIIHIYFDTSKSEEAAVLKMLSMVRNGIRCGFIKTVFRSACVELPLNGFSYELDFSNKKNVEINNNLAEEMKQNKLQQINSKNEKRSKEKLDFEKPVKDFDPNTILFDNTEPEINNTEMVDDFDSLFGAMDDLGHQ